MAEPFIGEIRMFGGNFAPRSWALCDGQLLPISSNSALFSILGTTYGGDGRTTMGLPDMRGRVPVHAGNGPGLSNYNLGARGGTETVTLTANQIPSHRHTFGLGAGIGATPLGNDSYLAANAGGTIYTTTDPNGNNLGASTISNTGGGQSHTNIQPYCCVNFIIALQGLYPSRS